MAVGAAVGVAGLATFLHIRRVSNIHSAQPTPSLAGDEQSGVSGLIVVGLLGVAGWYVWSKYKSLEDREEYVFANPKKKYKKGKSSSGGGGYFVRVSGTKESWPKPGSEYYPRGYPLRKAQDFARIGSQTGSPRKVLRGGSSGVVVRKYVDGKRVWPKTVAQAGSLRPAERPSKLRKSA